MNLAPEVERLVAAKSESELCQAILVASRELGYRWGSGFAAWRDGAGSWRFRRFGVVPPEFLATYTDQVAAQVDPAMQYMKHSSLPLMWDKRIYEQSDRMNMWEEQASHGITSGISAALHLRMGKALCFGLDGDDDHWMDPREKAAVIGRFQVFHAHLEDAFARVIGWPPSAEKCASDQLTARELECLRWAAEGKTTWEIGQLLHISERTVKKHIGATMAALDCVTKTHAVARAIRMQLI